MIKALSLPFTRLPRLQSSLGLLLQKTESGSGLEPIALGSWAGVEALGEWAGGLWERSGSASGED